MTVLPPNDLGDWNQRTNSEAWTPNTRIQLCNVPWDSTYRDIVNFTHISALNQFVTDNTIAVHDIDRMTIAKPNHPIRINLPYNVAAKANYVRVYNGTAPIEYDDGAGGTNYGDEPRQFYYFITNVTYIAPNTTELTVQLDVWLTYKWQITGYGRGYLEQGHAGIANDYQNHNRGKTFLTEPEGHDLGGEYVTTISRSELISKRDSDGVKVVGVIVWSTVRLDLDLGTVDEPIMHTANSTRFHNLPNGAKAYYFSNLESYGRFLQYLSDKPWASQGIISVMVVPTLEQYHDGDVSGNEFVFGDGANEKAIIIDYLSTPKPVERVMYPDATNMYDLPSRYVHLKKFGQYPYRFFEVTLYNGKPLVVKPEQLDSDSLTLLETPYFALPAPRLMFTIKNYGAQNQTIAGEMTARHRGEYLDMATGITDFPTFSTVNNSYISFLASNANGLAYQHDSADWSQQRAMNAANSAYDSAGRDIADSRRHNELQISHNERAASIDTSHDIVGAAGNAISSIGAGAMGGPMGLALGAGNAAMGAVNTATNISRRNQHTSLNANTSRSAQNISAGNQQFHRDSNLDLARFSSQGDYANAIAGIQAKVQDAKLTQPTVSGQLGGDAFNIGTDNWHITVKVKQIHSGIMQQIGEYWLRYGYRINRFYQPTNLSVMTKFTYWKFKEFYITHSTIPEKYKLAIRGIFEKGVTVWNDPEDIGVVDPGANMPIAGIVDLRP